MELIFGSVRTTYTTQFIDQVRAGWRAGCGIANARRVSRVLLCAIGFLSCDRRRLSLSLSGWGRNRQSAETGQEIKAPLPSPIQFKRTEECRLICAFTNYIRCRPNGLLHNQCADRHLYHISVEHTSIDNTHADTWHHVYLQKAVCCVSLIYCVLCIHQTWIVCILYYVACLGRGASIREQSIAGQVFERVSVSVMQQSNVRFINIYV